MGSVYPWKEVFQMDKSAFICSGDPMETILEQSAVHSPPVALTAQKDI